MRIAHVTATFPPYMSGTGNNCFHSALGLARQGHQVTVYTATYPPRAWVDPPDITVVRLPAILRFGNAPLLPGLMQIRDVDIIHLHYPFIFGAELIWTISKIRNIPYVLTYQNDLIGEGTRRYIFDAYSKVFTGMVLGGASKFAVVSLDHAQTCRMSSFFRRRWSDVVEVPNGVDAELFRPLLTGLEIRKKYGISPNDDLVLFVGGLDRAHFFKGVSVLLHAFSKLSRTNAKLMIVGDGDMREEYQSEAQNLGISPNTIFAGYIPFNRLPEYYNSANIVVLPSLLSESFGIVLIEAMACEKPVIASNLPGLRSVVMDEKEGLLVRPGDSESLAEKIRLLLDNPQKQREMGIRGRAKVESKYAWPKIIPRLIQMYEEVLDSREITDPRGKNKTQKVSE
jgi:glycosyltransferase involved in cell wall biosynthesis